jgi:hypothetical protein
MVQVECSGVDVVRPGSVPTVQQQIDEQLRAYPGGTQTGPYEVAYQNGSVVVVFADGSGRIPTTPVARPEIGASASAVPATSDTYGCPYGTLTHWFCFYDNDAFNSGTNGRMLEFKSCSSEGTVQLFTDWGFNDQTTSWVNTGGGTRIDVFDNADLTGKLWAEPSYASRVSNVGAAANDMASAFKAYC